MKLDDVDRKLLFEALCFYDMHKEEYFTSEENASFHYLYGELNPNA